MTGTTTTTPGGGPEPGSSAQRDAVQVAPLAAVPDEAAVLVLGAGPPVPDAGSHVRGTELHGALGGEQRAARDGQDVQSRPAHVVVEVEPGRTGRRVPGGEQVAGVAESEGAVPRSHELLGGAGGGGAVVQPPAALGVGQPRPAGASSGSHPLMVSDRPVLGRVTP